MAKAILFDFDLTLLDSAKYLKIVFAQMKKKYGIISEGMTRDEIWANNNRGFAMRLAELSGNKMSWKEVQAAYHNCLSQVAQEQVLREQKTLKRFNSEGIPIGIISGNSKEAVMQILKNPHNKEIHFKPVIGSTEGKPKFENIKTAVLELKISKKETFYVGDHPKDIMEAKKAGVIPIAITTGFHSRSDLEKYEPAAVIDRICELESLIHDI